MLLKRAIEALCDRICRAVIARLSEEMDAADGCGELQIEVRPALPAPEKKGRKT